MKKGDLVLICGSLSRVEKKGVIVGFNKKGEGGKDYVHVLVDGSISIHMRFAIEVISEGR